MKVGPETGILTVPGELNHLLYLLSGDQFLTYRAEPPDAGPRPGASRVSPRQLSTADRMARELTDDGFIGHGPRPPAEPLVAGVEQRTKRLCVLWPYSQGRAAGVPGGYAEQSTCLRGRIHELRSDSSRLRDITCPLGMQASSVAEENGLGEGKTTSPR